MFKHYCDICKKEISGKAKIIEIKDYDVPTYSTSVYSQPSISCISSACMSAKPELISNVYVICNECAVKIKKMTEGENFNDSEQDD